jgi:hypothetical protein
MLCQIGDAQRTGLGEVRIIALVKLKQKFNFYTKDEDNKKHNSIQSAETKAK